VEKFLTQTPVLSGATLGGQWPRKPEAVENLGFTDELWSMVERCRQENLGG